ncbi:thiolase family protein [Streptomyces sp. NPDC051956]|uniref:thiolase family protein n=1 Tax=Streptomyces sp. NPDC051956 TaxID=3365677 RepID=UPI0037D83DEF
MNDIAIVGFGETQVGLRTGRSSYDLASEVVEEVLEATGLGLADIDGLAIGETMSETSNPFWAVYMSEHLGLSPTWLQLNGLGGASTIGGVARAASAIRDDLCETVLVLASDAQSSYPAPEYGAHRAEFQYPTGLKGPVGSFGLLTRRYIHQFGNPDQALAKLAVTQRNHALLNPLGTSKLRKPITEADYLTSKVVSDPLRMLDSVMVCDGANALLVTSTENARRKGLDIIAHPTGYGEITNFNVREQLADITRTGFSVAGPRAFKQAGLTPGDIRMLHLYDDFLIALILTMEQVGFCEPGEGVKFVLDHDFSYTGDLPLNTSGGQISAGQPGLAGGGLNAVEAVRQMAGKAGERQVDDPRNALVTGIGAIPYGRNWAVSNAMILERP